MSLGNDLEHVDERYASPICVLVGIDSVTKLYKFRKRHDCPFLRNDPHVSLLVAGPYFHTAPILLRCSSTQAASAVTSSMSCGSGLA